jgi:hypothetical protein
MYSCGKLIFCADDADVPYTAAASLSVACQKPKDFDAFTIQSHGSTVPSSVTITPIPSHYHPNYAQDTDTIVNWDGPEDPENPRNWAKKQRWILTLVVSLFTFIRYLFHSDSGPFCLSAQSNHQSCSVLNLVSSIASHFCKTWNTSRFDSRKYVALHLRFGLCSWSKSGSTPQFHLQ